MTTPPEPTSGLARGWSETSTSAVRGAPHPRRGPEDQPEVFDVPLAPYDDADGDADDDTGPADQLRRIEAVTDSDLADLDVDELLAELLERVREILSADTAAVLLLDPSATHLVATAACGIEEEVRQGVRIPLGKGFAGRVAAAKIPVILDHVDHTNVLNPILREKGIRSLLGVPLLAGGNAIGVLHVGTLSSRTFTDQDSTLLQLAADRMALATQSRLARAERTAALMLQRSLVPARLPSVSGLEFAARYVPAGDRGIGGDWYDAFGLPSGWVCLVVGDVVGRGLPAAISMGRLRGAVRSYALDTVDPAELLGKIDRQVHHFESDGMMATALCAMVEPSRERLLLSSAGHPPPLSVRPDQPAVFLDPPVDLPLGVDVNRPRHTTAVALPPGARVCFYTDGLIERRSMSIDAGLERLRRSAFAASADAMCATILSELLGADPTNDDVALLVLHRPDGANSDPLELHMPATPLSLQSIRTDVRRWLFGVGATPDEVHDLVLVIGEACSNVIEHAYGPLGGTVSVHLRLQPPDVVATVSDSGGWRNPHQTGQRHGLGITLMHGLSDEVRIEPTPTGTRTTIRKALTVSAQR